jgi:hypothetical protein
MRPGRWEASAADDTGERQRRAALRDGVGGQVQGKGLFRPNLASGQGLTCLERRSQGVVGKPHSCRYLALQNIPTATMFSDIRRR